MAMQQVGIEFITRGERQAQQAIQNLGRSVNRLTGAQVSASQASNRLEAQRQKEARELERLRSKYVQGYAAIERYSRELKDLDRARMAGIISSKQQAAEIQRLNAAFRSSSDANHVASRRTNAYGMAMQQAGYQVGDFIVQIQSGTNAFVAFGQQATQMVGVLPMLAGQFNMNVTRLIAISSVLGVVIPLVTALGAAFMRTRDSAKKAEDAISKLSDGVSEYSSAVDVLNMSQSELNDEFGAFSGYAVKAANALKEIAIYEVNKQIESLADNLTDVSSLMGRTIPSNINKTVKEFLTLNEGILRNNELVADFINAQIKVSQAEGPKAQAEAMNNLMDLFVSIVGEYDDMNDEQKKYYESLRAALDEISKFGAAQEDVVTSQERIKKLQELSNQELQVGNGLADDYSTKAEEIRKAYEDIAGEIGDAAAQALVLAGLDITLGINNATKAAAELAAQMGISVEKAAELQLLNRQNEKYAGRGATSGREPFLQGEDGPVAVSSILEEAEQRQQRVVTALENQYRLYAETRVEAQQLNDEIERGLRNIAQGSVRLNQENQSILDQQIEMFRRTQKMKEEMGESAYEALRLSGNLNEVKDKSSEAANEAIRLRNALAEASSATQTLGLDVERKIAVIRARNKALQEGTNTAIAGEIALLRQKRNEIVQNLAQQGATADQIARQTEELSANINEYEKLKNENNELRGSITKTGSATKKVTEETKKANKEYKTFNDILSDAYVTAGEFEQQMGQNVVSAIDSVSNAFADFVSRGFRDFSSFVDSVWSSFKNLLMQMIATAAKNRILISLGVTGGSTMGTAANAATSLAGGGGGPLGMLSSGTGILGAAGSFLGVGALTGGGAAAGGLIGGALGSVQGLLGGGVTGMANAMSFGVSQGMAVGGAAGIGSAIGAIAGPIAIAAAAISFFSSKTKELDNGLKVTVGSVEDLTESMAEVESVSAKLKGTPIFSNKLQQQEQQKIQDTLDQIQKSAEEAAVNGQAVIIETFRKIEKSRFWGLSKSRRTQTDIASQETASPIREAIFNVQRSILDAAESLGVAADTFEGFSYDFKVSLKGLSEEEQMQAITEEINKMGDAFAALAPNIENMNELMTAAQQRYELETRLMQLQGKEAELLARRRQEELNGTHPLNIELLERIHLLEDQRVEEQKAAAIAQERYNLETQLLQLQGDTQELRKRELALLDESNRDLQKEIWALQDAQDAARAAERSQRDLVRAQEQAARSAEQMVNDLLGLVDEANFATRYGFEKTRGLVASGVIEDRTQIPRFADGGYHSGGARIVGEDGPELEITGPSRIISNKSLDNIASGNISVKSEISKMRQEMRAMMVQISKNTGKTSKQLDRWDRDGLPSDRGY